MLRTWLSTVRSEMNRRAPICLLLRPSRDQPRDVGFPLRERRHARIVWSRGDDMSRLAKRRSDCGVPAQALSGVELGLEA